MDSKLVSDLLSTTGGSERDSSFPFLTYTEQFYEHFPYYFAIGMTYDQYWNDDPVLVKYYRKADEIKLERMNEEKWLQGMYIYEAICDASPILNPLAKKGTKAHPYADKPYPITGKQRKQDNISKEKAVAEKGKKLMQAFMELNNGKHKNKDSDRG